ncbi:MAG: hypothetical protein QNJ22_05785 [Desulfosarcinaceae bacterium]|nr:hypothetical protein [Desulfosarcinaceae bacterium]
MFRLLAVLASLTLSMDTMVRLFEQPLRAFGSVVGGPSSQW